MTGERLILSVLKLLCFSMFMLTGGLICAFVFDCEPLSEEKHYHIERDAFNHNRDRCDWNSEFPSFSEWKDHQDKSESRMREWLNNVKDEIGYQAAETFDPWYERPEQDTSCSHSACAPDNWASGERG